VYDLSGVVNKKLSVYYNKQKVKISDFKDYCSYYLRGMTQKDATEEIKVAYMSKDRWEVLAGASEGEFHQVSFVNSICTSRGGTHIDYLVNQVCEGLIEEAQKRVKKIKIKNHFIKSNIFIIVNCLVENPAFDSQTKETLITKPANFGSTVELGDKFFKDLIKTGIIDQIIFQAQAREDMKMQKQLKGVKKSRLLGINKLEDANKAGTKDSLKCTLILTEGDSAKALAMNGLEVIGRDFYGVFPLRGKFLNVREASNETILKNQEVSQLIEIIGLSVGKKYNGDLSSLRYGSIMIMTDQDHDGSHIKGLIINFIHHFWPDLIKSNTFLREFVTPIIKASKGSAVHPFFTINDFKIWANERINNLKGWKIKYYKGLGTSDDKEAKEYFQNIDLHEIKFRYDNDQDDDAVDLAFNKKKADDRKEWLTRYDPDTFVDHNIKVLRYYDFIHKELIAFSIANNQRAIPSLCDGLKTGQRKILFSCFKRRLTKEIKVAQLSGYVAEHSEYHHGEQNLVDTIIGMAQTFVGSNNINLLMPNGQFGSRAMGGKDAASGRYLHTVMNKITRFIFLEDDDHVLNYIEEDGKLVEPIWYLPIIPMVLVNGSEGIGTGWSTNIPNYCPRALIENLLRKLDGGHFDRMDPFYKGYTGEILSSGDRSYSCKGRWSYDEDAHALDILELPIRKWTRDYKTAIEQIMIDKNDKQLVIEDMREYHTTRNVHFRLLLAQDQRPPAEADVDKVFKLTTNISCNNMVLFDSKSKIKKYASELDILEEFYLIRLQFYQLRKDYLLSRIVREVAILNNKLRFIMDVNDDRIVISKKNKKAIVSQLIQHKYTKKSDLPRIQSSIEDNLISKIKKEEEEAVEEDQQGREMVVEESREIELLERDGKEFDYLLSMQLWSLSLEQVEKLKKELQSQSAALEDLKKTDINDMWRQDLKNLREVLDKVEDEELKEIEKEDRKNRKANRDEKPKPKRKKKQQDASPPIRDEDKSATIEDKKPIVKIKKPAKQEDDLKDKKTSGKQQDLLKFATSSQTASLQVSVEELERRLANSTLRFFIGNDPEKKKKILNILRQTRKELESKGRDRLSIEERTYLDELIKKEALSNDRNDSQDKKIKTAVSGSVAPTASLRQAALKLDLNAFKAPSKPSAVDSEEESEDAVMDIMKSRQKKRTFEDSM